MLIVFRKALVDRKQMLLAKGGKDPCCLTWKAMLA